MQRGGTSVKPARGRYVLISPCRNEEAYARTTLDSVIGQTVPPALWVIVDDGSTDGTPQILADYARRVDFIRVVRRPDRGHRHVGPGVIESFYDGLETIDPNDFEYLCKLDLDLQLPPGYFEMLIERMEANPRIGTCSGKPYFRNPDNGRLVSEKCGDDTSVGMTKFYRVNCFHQIGGFVREVMWDGIDCHRCRMLGWMACSWDDPELRFQHLRPEGTSDQGVWRGRVRHGFGQYFMGTGAVYMLASALFRMTRPPHLIGGAGMLWGYASSALQKRPRYADREFRRFLRRYHRSALLRGKVRALKRVHQRQASRWNPEVLPALSAPSFQA